MKLRTALPAPSGTDAATPLKRCLSERVQAGLGGAAEPRDAPVVRTSKPCVGFVVWNLQEPDDWF